MNNKKPENSGSSSRFSDYTGSEKPPIQQIAPTYESAAFSCPSLDQLKGIMPTFNKRLSAETDLRLSPPGNLRLSPETLSRLVSNSCSGFETAFTSIRLEIPKTPVGKGLEVKPDLAGRTLSGASLCSLTINADLPIAPLGSRFVTLRQTEDRSKKVEKEKKIENKEDAGLF